MKNKYLIVAFLAISISASAQNVGIGTSTPTAQLHTTGTVRHAILSGLGIRPVYVDSNGNLLTTLQSIPPSSSTNSNSQSIPDFNCAGVTSTNSLNGLPLVQSASISVTININHPRLADLSIYLTTPGGAIINLVSPAAALIGANFNNTVFIDAGVLLSMGTAPFNGQFKPYADMSTSICGITPTVATFGSIGGGTINPNGTWSLKVIDNTSTNTGTLNSWTISVVSGLEFNGVWGLKGNNGTNAFNFIGTTDNSPLRFRIKNVNSGIIDSLSRNTGFGFRTLDSIMDGTNNNAFGFNALKRNKHGNNNVAVGSLTMKNHTTGDENTVVGDFAMSFNNSTGSGNSALGTACMLNTTSGSYNTAIGSYALNSNSTGSYNIAIGTFTGSGGIGNANVAIGTGALANNGFVSNLVAIGDSALHTNFGNQGFPNWGTANTAVGSKTLYSNQNGFGNSAHGYQALYSNTAGFSNTAMGAYALHSNTDRSGLVAIGDSSLFNNNIGALNTALGYKSLYTNTSGSNNSASGYQALVANTTGSYNTASGTFALASNTDGWNNTAYGSYSLLNNHSGTANVAMGSDALHNNVNGFQNTAVGSETLFNNFIGKGNTAVGFSSLHDNGIGADSSYAGFNAAFGINALYHNTIGSSNTAIGEETLSNNTTGESNTAIGSLADVGANNLSNATAIGAEAIVNQSNTIQLGNGAVTTVNTYGNITVLNGKGIIRSIDGTQQKKLTAAVTVIVTILPLSTTNFSFSFPESFSGIPDVYIGSCSGLGGFAEVIMSVSNISTTGGSLFVSNPRTTSVSPNFSVKIIAIGPQ